MGICCESNLGFYALLFKHHSPDLPNLTVLPETALLFCASDVTTDLSMNHSLTQIFEPSNLPFYYKGCSVSHMLAVLQHLSLMVGANGEE